jgi:hypothetical protein
MVPHDLQDQLSATTLDIQNTICLRYHVNDRQLFWQVTRTNTHRSIEAVMGETPDISEYLDFGFYDWVWFKRDAGIGEIELERFLSISRNTGSLMSYHILPKTGVPISRTRVQRVATLEKQTNANQQQFPEFEKAIMGRYKEGRIINKGNKPALEDWSELLETNPDFAERFALNFDNPDV